MRSPRSVRHLAAAGAVAASLFAVPAAATPMDTLATIAGTYNVYVSGNLGSAAQPYTSDSEGAMAVGGNAFFRSFAVGGVNTHGAPALTVGGNLTYEAGTIHGDAWVGGNASFPLNYGGTTVTGSLNVGTLGTAPTQVGGTTTTGAGPVPLNFASVTADLQAASQFLQSAAAIAQGTLGSVALLYGHQLHLTGTGTGINYFNLTDAQFAVLGSGSFTIDAPAGSTAIINVSGSSITVGSPGNFGFFYNGIGVDHVLFNFYEATTLAMQSFDGSILAPLATVSYVNGQMNGTLMAANLSSTTWQNGEFHDDPFRGLLPQIAETGDGPTAMDEPAPLAVLGFGLLAAAGLRRLSGRRNAR